MRWKIRGVRDRFFPRELTKDSDSVDDGKTRGVSASHFVEDYERLVSLLKATYPAEEAMQRAVGGYYDEMGELQANFLASYLEPTSSVVDLGCGSGRTAKHLGVRYPRLTYLGLDVVQDLLDYAATQSPSHFSFSGIQNSISLLRTIP